MVDKNIKFCALLFLICLHLWIKMLNRGYQQKNQVKNKYTLLFLVCLHFLNFVGQFCIAYKNNLKTFKQFQMNTYVSMNIIEKIVVLLN